MTVMGAVIFFVHFWLQIANLAFWGLLVFLLGIVKLLFPIASLRRLLMHIMHHCYLAFGRLSVKLITLFNDVNIDCRIEPELSKKNWYLLLANHLSYLDIILLINFSAGKIPPPKFFLKKELIWLPFVGLAAWALDMPFMQRYSQAYLKKYPHKKGKDIETTRRSCQHYKLEPTSVINFVEGTRFTTQKHAQKNSPFHTLLPPKAGGIAFTLAAMGDLFTEILDVTLAYPNNSAHPMVDMLSGQLTHIVIDVRVLPLPAEAQGDYFNDVAFREMFQSWLNGVWSQKDGRLQQILE